MSTHFRPRPPSVPTSPARPSTAHSTIRAVTPSPPHDLPRPKSAHAINSPDLTTFAQYVLQSDDSNMFSNTPPTNRPGPGALRRSGARTSRSVSPVKRRMGRSGSSVKPKARMGSPAKRKGMNAVEKMGYEKEKRTVVIGEKKVPVNVSSDNNDDDDGDVACPDTPTPMSRDQKRSAYLPLRSDGPIPLSLPAPLHPHHHPHLPPPLSKTSPTTTSTSPPIPHKSPTRISLSATSNLTALSATSKTSIFSTPGRDELERKKALVEVDEGPFGGAVSVADLREERRRVTSAENRVDRDGGGGGGDEEEGKKKGKGMGRGRVGCEGCGCGCVVM